MAERWRFYLAGVLQTAGGLWVLGWALSHWIDSLVPLFGPKSVLPVPVGMTLLNLGLLLQFIPRAARLEGAVIAKSGAVLDRQGW